MKDASEIEISRNVFSNISIIPLRNNDCSETTALHMAYLRTHLFGYVGKSLLTCNYRAMVSQHGACCYVARADDRVVGFVCGVWEPNTFRRTLLRGQWLALSFWGFLYVLTRPKLIKDFLNRFFKPSHTPAGKSDVGYELRPIVVDLTVRGKGVAQRLLDELLQDAARRGFDKIFLYTEDDNLAAQTFYRKTGFVQDGQVARGDAVYLRYEREIDY